MRVFALLCMLAACDDGRPAPSLPAWDKTLPPASVMGTWNGLVPARGIVHLHSPFSHDACDGMPRDPVTGAVNEPCLQSLRAALCTDRIDFAALTDHDDTMADEEFPALFHPRDGDEVVLGAGGTQIASRIHCDNGQEVLVTVGGENELMPIMLDHHVAGTVPERHALYNGDSPTEVAALRDAGATVWIAHTEQRTTAHLLELDPDGIELYNLHANIDPKIRPMYLGLDAYGAITAAIEFADTNEGGPEPDLAMLAFLTPNLPALARWDEVLATGKKLAATAGSDAHENALPVILADGERGDSYRRVLRWFSNIVLVVDPRDPAQIEESLRRGSVFAVFELLGTPEGFSVTAGATTLGGTASVGSPLTVTVPTVRGLDPSLPAPEIHATVVRVDATGRTDLGGTDVVLDRPGAYRVEVSIVPHHLGPYLRDLGTALADQELPWIYTSPIYVQ
jgi:hypothetical protein